MTERSVPAARVVWSPEDRRRVLALIERALESGSLTLGEVTTALEQAFATRHGMIHAVATNSGTSALEILFRAFNLVGAAIVVPTNTFFATAAAVVHSGGRLVFADVDAATLALSAETVSQALTPETRAVVIVHIGGMICPEVDAIADLCRSRDLLLIEDAAHAHGSFFKGRVAGTFGHAAAFSFYPTKVVTSAEGGMITTADERVRNEALIYRDQGKAGFLGSEHVRMGSAWRMSELHAAAGLVHLDRLDEFIAVRRRVAGFYDRALRGVTGLTLLPEPVGSVGNYYKYPILLDARLDRTRIRHELRERHRVSLAGEVYARPLHCQPVFESLAHRPLPIAEDVCARQICLPVHSDMLEDEAEYVVESLIDVLGANGTGGRHR